MHLDSFSAICSIAKSLEDIRDFLYGGLAGAILGFTILHTYDYITNKKN
jgi:hypothetical protein